MNEIVSKFLLVGDRYMPEMHLRLPDLLIVLVERLLKIKKKFKNLKKREIQAAFTKTN